MTGAGQDLGACLELTDPALIVLALFLLVLGAAPALAALGSTQVAQPSPEPQPVQAAPSLSLIQVASIGAAAALDIAEAHGLSPVTALEWRGDAWLIRGAAGESPSGTIAVCPWSGRVVD